MAPPEGKPAPKTPMTNNYKMDIAVRFRLRNDTDANHTLLLVACNGLGTEFGWLDVSILCFRIELDIKLNLPDECASTKLRVAVNHDVSFCLNLINTILKLVLKMFQPSCSLTNHVCVCATASKRGD